MPWDARSMLADFGMCADIVVRTDSSSGWRLARDKDLIASGSLCVGAAASTRPPHDEAVDNVTSSEEGR